MFSKQTKFRATVSMLFGLLSSPIALAETAAKVGARTGMVDVDNLGSTIGFGGYGEMAVTPEVSIRPSLDYWQVTKGSDVGLAKVKVEVSDLTIGGAIKYAASLPGWTARPYALGGLAMHRLSVNAAVSNDFAAGATYRSEARETKIGFDLGGGVSYPLSSGMELSGEVLMRSVDEADLLSLTAGIAYKL